MSYPERPRFHQRAAGSRAHDRVAPREIPLFA